MRTKSAFSLTELLVTIAIMALIGAMGFPAMKSLRSTKLVNSGNQIADLANQARQNAITHNTPTALVLAVKTGDSKLDYRLFCLVEYRSTTQTWGMVSPWTLLPTEVLVDSVNSGVFVSDLPTLSPAIGELKYLGKTISSGNYSYQVFLSDGTMESSQIKANTMPVLRLVQDQAAVQANYYDIILNVYTGITKIERP